MATHGNKIVVDRLKIDILNLLVITKLLVEIGVIPEHHETAVDIRMHPVAVADIPDQHVVVATTILLVGTVVILNRLVVVTLDQHGAAVAILIPRGVVAVSLDQLVVVAWVVFPHRDVVVVALKTMLVHPLAEAAAQADMEVIINQVKEVKVLLPDTVDIKLDVAAEFPAILALEEATVVVVAPDMTNAEMMAVIAATMAQKVSFELSQYI